MNARRERGKLYDKWRMGRISFARYERELDRLNRRAAKESSERDREMEARRRLGIDEPVIQSGSGEYLKRLQRRRGD